MNKRKKEEESNSPEPSKKRRSGIFGGDLPTLFKIYLGKVVSIQSYGAFVAIPGFEKNGLIHVSQISQSKVDNVSDVLSIDDKVWSKVISLGTDDDKISLSMKVVDQGSGQDLDPNNVQVSLDEQRKKPGGSRIHPKLTLEAVLNTICKKCGTKGHLAQDCFQIPGGKTYELIPEDDSGHNLEIPLTDTIDKPTKKKKHKHSKDKKKQNSPQEDTAKDKKDKEHKHKKHKKKHKHH